MGFIDEIQDATDITSGIESTLEKIFDAIGRMFDTIQDKVTHR